ncbi:MAG: hypothetical protein JWM11_4693 [Planctomycetaceae bacterium]|nr:hypothetical protein [Planctomycetaceae bacterium]
MSEMNLSQKLLQGVALRMRLASWGRRWRLVFFVLCAIYAVPLLVSRLTGYWMGQFVPIHLPILGVIALGISGIWHRRPTLSDAARRLDQHGNTRDLFLTWTMLQQSAGEFQPWVRQAAESTAQQFQPRQIIQFPWQKPFLQVGVALILLWTGLTCLPQLDPFGKIAQAKDAEESTEKLSQSRRATKDRLAELVKSEADPSKTSDVEKALEKLKQVFSKLEKSKPSENKGKLASEQKQLGKLWQKMTAEKMAEMLKKSAGEQAFGEPGHETMEKWTEELKSGNADSLKKELAGIQDSLQRLSKSKDPGEQAQLRQELKKKMQKLKEFADQKLENKGLKAALDRALAQMETSKREPLEQEALDAAKETMKLVQQELKQMELNAKEMKELDDALKAIQMAKKLNDEGKLETDQDDGFTTLEEYKELYAQLMEGREESEGEGTPDGGGEGQGMPVDEDDSVKTNFKPEQSKSAVKAGEILMSINTKGVAPKDAPKEDPKVKYKNLVRTVKEGAEEAILQEQIPPGYHDGIKGYFNALDDAPQTKEK